MGGGPSENEQVMIEYLHLFVMNGLSCYCSALHEAIMLSTKQKNTALLSVTPASNVLKLNRVSKILSG